MAYKLNSPNYYDTNQTFAFRYFFPAYETEDNCSFKEFIKSIKIPSYNATLQTLEYNFIDVDTKSGICEFIYEVLKGEYYNTNVLFDTPQEFLQSFKNYFVNYFQVIERQIITANKLYSLTDEEVLLVNREINNMSNNDNEIREDTEQPLDYISNQMHNIKWSNKLRSYIKYIQELPSLQIGTIISYFRPLFRNIYTREDFLYE